MSMAQEAKDHHIRGIKAVIDMAASNFPRDTNVTILARGDNHASITIPSWVLREIVDAAEKSS